MSTVETLQYEALCAEQSLLTNKLYTEFLTPLKKKMVFDKLDTIGKELNKLRSS